MFGKPRQIEALNSIRVRVRKNVCDKFVFSSISDCMRGSKVRVNQDNRNHMAWQPQGLGDNI
jgi:hypothetical protein